MKKIFLTLTLVAGLMATAQVKIGDRPTVIDGNSLLELETTNQGLLYPRVNLTSTTSYAPLSEISPNIKQPGMTVYNTATTITGTNDVTPGLYVNDGFNWIRVTPATKNLYTDNGTLTSARTVTLNNNNLTFTAGGGTGIMGSDKLKIGANPTVIDANSLLELETINKGLLYPRVALERTDSYAPLSAVNPLTLVVEKQKGMTVYNTATSTLYGTNNVTEGLYTNDGTNWVKVTPKALYTDDSAITSARTVTLNNNDLTFTAGVGGTGKTVVASTFKTGGAVYGNYRVVTTQLNTAAWLDTDYAIIGTSASNLSLPNASSNLGRIISYTNQSGSNRTYDAGGANNENKPQNNSIASAGKGYLMIATTSGWQVIGGY